MPKKSIRFIARDLGRSFDEVKQAIEDMGMKPDDASSFGTGTYTEESQKKIQVRLNAGIDWYCDKCNVYLNNQSGFNTISGTWICEECGHENSVTVNNVINW